MIRFHIPWAVLAAILLTQSAFAQITLNSLTDSTPGLSQSLAQVGSGPLTLTVKGTGFTSSSVARLGATALTTTFVDTSTLTAIITSSQLKAVGAQNVTVVDGSITSNPLALKTTYRTDTNGGGTVSIGDALVIALSAGGLLKPVVPVSVGDLNLNDSVNIGDALVAALFTGGLKTNLDTPGITAASLSGSSLTLTGTGFSSIAASNVIVFSTATGYTSAQTSSVTTGSGSKTLTVTVPSGAVSGPVFVKRTDLGLPGQPFVVGIPGSTLPLYVSKISPAAGLSAGSSIVLTGSGFDSTAANNTVTFSAAGGTTVGATPVSATPSSLTVTVPSQAVSGFVFVTIGSANSNRKSILVNGSPTPLLVNHVYYSETPGEPVLIEGTGFNVTAPSDNEILFNDVPGVIVAAGRTELVALLPTGPATGTLKVRTGAGTVASNNWTYSTGTLPTPLVSSVTFLDPVSNVPVKELLVNENNTIQPRLRILDSTGAERTDVGVTFTSLNTEVATVDTSGNILGRKAGFSTLIVAAGGVVATATITVVQVSAGINADETSGVAQDLAGRLYVASSTEHAVLLAQSLGQAPDVYAGVRQSPGLTNGERLQSLFRSPSFLAFNQADGTLFVADSANNVIRRIQPGPGGRVETLAGTGAAGSQDGPASSATFRNPQGVALDDRGNLWVVDSGNHTIRKINLAARTVSTIAGQAGSQGIADGSGSQARFSAPLGIALETVTVTADLDRFFGRRAPPAVRMVVADSGNGLIRRISENGLVETLALNSSALTLDGPKSFAVTAPIVFNLPFGIAVDSFGTIYVTEPGSGRVKAILRNGDIVDAAQINTFTGPRGLTVARSGRLVVSSKDRSAREVRFGQPEIASVTPAQIRNTGGATVTIRGTNFAPDTAVIVAGTVISNVQIQDTQTLTFTAPALSSGRTTLTVQNRGGLAQTLLLIESVPLSELPAGHVTTVAGGSTFAGDGGSATVATIAPSSMAVDPNGNLLIADIASHLIRRLNLGTGIVTSIAGNGVDNFSGDGGPALAAAMNTPLGIAADSSGNLFISDSYNHRIRRVDATTGIITTFAGTGSDAYSGDNGPAIEAGLNLPSGLAFDRTGNLFVADTHNHRIRRIDPNGVITTVAGDGQARFAGDNGPGKNSSLNEPLSLFFDSAGNLFIADSRNDRIRKLDTNGIITTVAGTGQNGSSGDGGPALSAQIGAPAGIAVDSDGNLYFPDSDYSRVRKVTAGDLRIATFAGTGNFEYSGDGGPATSAGLKQPTGIAIDAGGNVYIADLDGRRVRRVDGKTGIISTSAGNGQGVFLGENGPATSAVINYPLAIAFDNTGNLLIGDSDNRVRNVNASTGVITIVAGGGNPDDGVGDGLAATNAGVWTPAGIAVDRDGNVYISDTGHGRVRKINKQTQVITTIAGNGSDGFSGDGGLATQAILNIPSTLALDPAGNLLIADESNRRIRKIDFSTGKISTVAGNGSTGFTGDGGLATAAGLSNVAGFVLDTSGNIYIPDYENGRVRRVDAATNIITTIAGGGESNSSPVRATEAVLAPTTLAFDGRLFIMDLIRLAVLQLDANGFLKIVAGNGDAAFAGDGGPATAGSFSYPKSMVFDSLKNLFIADSNNHRIRAVRGPLP